VPATPQKHKTAAFIYKNSKFELLRFLSAVPAVMTWQGFNYLRTSIATTPPPASLVSSPPLSFPLRI
jgi:hypothetical protein